MTHAASGVDLAQGDIASKFDLVSTWDEECGIFEYAHALSNEEALKGRLASVYARDGERGDKTADSSKDESHFVKPCWGTEFGGQRPLIEELSRSDADGLWFQYHPSFFSHQDLRALAEALPKTRFRRRILTIHNPDGLEGGHFTSAFTDIIVHNADALQHLDDDARNKAKVIPHFIYSRSAFDQRPRASNFTVATVGFAAANKQVPLLINAFSIAHALFPDMRLRILTSPYPTHSATIEMSRIVSAIKNSPAREAIDADMGKKPMDRLLSQLSEAHLLCLPYADSAESASGAARLGLSAGVPLLRSKSSIFRDLPGGDISLEDTRRETIAESLLMLSHLPGLLVQKTNEIEEIYRRQSVSTVAARFAELLL